MKCALRITITALVLTLSAPGQPQALTAAELKYFDFLLMSAASLDHDPAAVKTFEAQMIRYFQLNAVEIAAYRDAAQQLKTLLADQRTSASAAVAGKSSLSASDWAVLKSIESAREQKVATLAAKFVAAVRPEIAARLRAPGRRIAAAVRGGAKP